MKDDGVDEQNDKPNASAEDENLLTIEEDEDGMEDEEGAKPGPKTVDEMFLVNQTKI